MKSRGFTLIELLVVIAIIGLLAGIVLVSLGGARDKAKDARIVTAMGQARTIAELVYDDAVTLQYNLICNQTAATDGLNSGNITYGTQLESLDADILVQGGASSTCYAVDDDFCISAPLASTGVTCVGSAGTTGSVACTSPTTCN